MDHIKEIEELKALVKKQQIIIVKEVIIKERLQQENKGLHQENNGLQEIANIIQSYCCCERDHNTILEYTENIINNIIKLKELVKYFGIV